MRNAYDFLYVISIGQENKEETQEIILHDFSLTAIYIHVFIRYFEPGNFSVV